MTWMVIRIIADSLAPVSVHVACRWDSRSPRACTISIRGTSRNFKRGGATTYSGAICIDKQNLVIINYIV